jgi:SAM-dependent methyltransferase
MDARLDAPAFHRNCAPIVAVLARCLTGCRGDVLEVGSGTGQHVVEFARAAPDIVWWPSDQDERSLASIAAWGADAGLANLRPPLRIDLRAPDWEAAAPKSLLAIFSANVLHIAPWAVAEGLMAGAGRRLASNGRLFVYGPFMREGRHTAPSNAAFDASLRHQDPAWGVRDVADVAVLAGQHGLRLADIVEMPANNLILVFEKL